MRRHCAIAALLSACAVSEPDGPDGAGIHFLPDAEVDRADARPRPDAEPECTPTWSNLLGNPGFDLGATVWLESSAVDAPIIIPTAQAHSGGFVAFVAGYDDAFDGIWQTVTIPSAATGLRVSGWRCIASDEDPEGGVFDEALIGIMDASGTTTLEIFAGFDNMDGPSATGCTWTSFLAAAAQVRAGQTVTFVIQAITDGSLPTSFFFDTMVFEAQVCL